MSEEQFTLEMLRTFLNNIHAALQIKEQADEILSCTNEHPLENYAVADLNDLAFALHLLPVINHDNTIDNQLFEIHSTASFLLDATASNIDETE